jgi:hypothetical protein
MGTPQYGLKINIKRAKNPLVPNFEDPHGIPERYKIIAVAGNPRDGLWRALDQSV